MPAPAKHLRQLSKKLTEGLTLEATAILIASTLILAFLLEHRAGLPLYRWSGYNLLMLFVVPLLVVFLVNPQRKRESAFWWTIWAFTLTASAVSVVLLLRMRRSSPAPQALLWLSPFILMTLVYLSLKAKPRLSDYGLCLGEFKTWVKVVLILFALMVPVLVLASRLEAFQRTYPLFRQAKESWSGFLSVQGYFGGYWFAWEFFFRGFMLFGLARRYGAPTAILIQAIPFTFLHFGKPELEVYGSFIAGIVLGYVDWRGRSILPSFLLHWMVALSMDLLAIFT